MAGHKRSRPEEESSYRSQEMDTRNVTAHNLLGISRRAWMTPNVCSTAKSTLNQSNHTTHHAGGPPSIQQAMLQETHITSTVSNNRSAPSQVARGQSQIPQPLRVNTTLTISNGKTDQFPLTAPLSSREYLSKAQKTHSIAHGSPEIAESVDRTDSTNSFPHNKSLPSPASSAIESPRTISVIQPQELTATTILEELQSDSNSLNRKCLPTIQPSNMSEAAEGITPISAESTSRISLNQDVEESRRLQQLLQRFGGVSGLEKHLESINQPNANTKATAQNSVVRQERYQSNPLIDPVELVSRTSSRTIIDTQPKLPLETDAMVSDTMMTPDADNETTSTASNTVQVQPDPVSQTGSQALSQLSVPIITGNTLYQNHLLPHSAYQPHWKQMYLQAAATSRRSTMGNQKGHSANPPHPPKRASTQDAIQSQQSKSGIPILSRNEVNMPTLDQFLENPHPWQQSIEHRLLKRLSLVLNTLPDNLPEKRTIKEQYRALHGACISMDSQYLVLFQTHAILTIPGVSIPLQDDATREAIMYLREIFPLSREVDRMWFAGFPCTVDMGARNMESWVAKVSGLIKFVGFYFKAILSHCQLQQRPPCLGEVEETFTASSILQEYITRALLVYFWRGSHDGCFTKILEAYRAARTVGRRIVDTNPPDLHQKLLENERTLLMEKINSLYAEHLAKLTPTRTATSIVWPLQSQTLFPVPAGEATNQTRSSAMQQNGMTMGSTPGFENRPVQYQYSMSQAASVRADIQASNPQRCPQRAATSHYYMQQNTQQNLGRSQLSDSEIARQIMQGTNPSITQNCQAWFPETPPTQGNSFGFEYSLEHARLRNPLSVIPYIEPQSKGTYRSFTTGLLCKGWTFGPDDISRNIVFEVSQDQLSKLAKETRDVLGGPPVRSVQPGSQFIRLRGVQGSPDTISGFVASETHWPGSMAILLNGQTVEFRHKPRNKTDLAADVSARMQLGTNTLSVSFLRSKPPSKDFNYLLALEVIEVADIRAMKAMVQLTDRKHVEDQLRKTFQGTNDSEMQMVLDHLNIAITDPFTAVIPTIPVRSIHCTHMQCFDLEVFLKSRPKDLSKSNQFLCPICSKDSRPQNLKIDGWMVEVIHELKAGNRLDAKMITVAPDLTWIVKGETLVGETGDGTGSQRGGLFKNQTNSKMVEVIDLD